MCFTVCYLHCMMNKSKREKKYCMYWKGFFLCKHCEITGSAGVFSKSLNRKSYCRAALFLFTVIPQTSHIIQCLPVDGLGFFSTIHPFPNPINSSCFRGQNNSLQPFPFIHSWHWSEPSPPTACYYLTHVPAHLLYVNSGRHTHTHIQMLLWSHTHTFLHSVYLFNWSHAAQTYFIFFIKFFLHKR